MNAGALLHADIGDWVRLEPRRPGEARRVGRVVEILGDPGFEVYRVQWQGGPATLVHLDEHLLVMDRDVETDEPVLVHEP